jgi:hypothetical protein
MELPLYAAVTNLIDSNAQMQIKTESMVMQWTTEMQSNPI